MKDIAIIVPAYNAAKTLEKSIESILAQEFRGSFIIYIVNDGSTDTTQEIIEKLKAKHPESIDAIYQENHGAAHARNTGARNTDSEYIIFCDADIVLMKNALQDMYITLSQQPTATYAYGSFYLGTRLFRSKPFNPEELKKSPYIHTTALIRRQKFPGFDESLKRFQDWDLWLTMLKYGNHGIYIDKVLFTIIADGTMSQWFPALFLKMWPLTQLPSVKKYKAAEKIIKQKHAL